MGLWYLVDRKGRKWKMFVGQFEHSLDEKNRIVLPAKFRSQLSSTVYISLDLDSCLSIYSEATYLKKAEYIASLDDFDQASRSLKRVFFANTYEGSVDKVGRLMIPALLLKKAKINKEVSIVGAFDHLQIFSSELLDSSLEKEEKDYEKLASQLRGEKNHALQ